MVNNDADDDDATEQCQEEESGSAFDIYSGTAAMEAYDSGSSDDSGPYCNTFKCAPSSLLTSCYNLTVHLHTVHIKNYVAFVEKENVLFLLLFKTG